MGDQRKGGISWTDQTWNPVRGCSRVSAGCMNCYAETMASRFSGPGQPYEGLAKNGKWTGVVKLIPEHLGDPLKWQRPRKIFVNSMSDLFHEALSNEEIAAVFGVMAATEGRHVLQVLTKRPERAKAWYEWVAAQDVDPWTVCIRAACGYLDHRFVERLNEDGRARDGAVPSREPWPLPWVWLGVSVEDQATADRRIPLLLQCPAAVRFVSYEPALGPVDFERVRWPERHLVDVLRGGYWEDRDVFWKGFVNHSDFPATLSWVVCGGESGPGARQFDIAWARSTYEQCKASGVAFFMKQDSGLRSGKQGRIPDDLWIKEFPK